MKNFSILLTNVSIVKEWTGALTGQEPYWPTHIGYLQLVFAMLDGSIGSFNSNGCGSVPADETEANPSNGGNGVEQSYINSTVFEPHDVKLTYLICNG